MTNHPPKYKDSKFQCPHCGILAQQTWGQRLLAATMGNAATVQFEVGGYEVAKCTGCSKPSIWRAVVGERIMVYPVLQLGNPPSGSMPTKVKAVYEEARAISGTSPRAACALLRVALEHLAKHLGAEGGNLNERIGDLVKRGIPEYIQKALDATRVCGNDAVHTEQLVLDDNTSQAKLLFEIVEYVVHVLIEKHSEIDSLYADLPESKIKGIEKRDK